MDEFKKDLKAEREAKHIKDINLLNMIESRIMEIVQIEDECKKKLPKLYSQRLPRFMRRRAACHDIRRIPRRLRPSSASHLKPRKGLLKYRRKKRFQKHKRILKRHTRHKYKDLNKCLMHKWFAKRFKMCQQSSLIHVPLYNNTKNQRNLYRQTRYGCAFISMAHLNALQLTFDPCLSVGELKCQLMQLNQLAFEISGFTFNARALSNTNYETLIHLYKPTDKPSTERDYICSVMAHLGGVGNIECPERTKQYRDASRQPAQLTIWVPKEKLKDLADYLNQVAENFGEKRFSLRKISPAEQTRVRLVGPDAWDQAMRVSAEAAPLASPSPAPDAKPIVQVDTKLGVKLDSRGDAVDEPSKITLVHHVAQNDAVQRLGSANDYREALLA